MIDGSRFAQCAYAFCGLGISYKTLDCQGFVERVLFACGVSCNYKGSNDMFRNMCTETMTKDECLHRFGKIPDGALLFTVKYDGKEPKRYKDGFNAAHVGINTNKGLGAAESSAGGVKQCRNSLGKWTHVGLCKYIEYGERR